MCFAITIFSLCFDINNARLQRICRPKKQTNFSSSTNSVTSVTSVNSISSNSSTNNDTSGRDPSTPSKPITLNMRVQVLGLKLSTAPTGTVRFVGPTTFAAGMWIGVELDQPVGKNNGSVQGHYYFNCSMNYGIFVKEEYVTPLLQNNSSNGSLKSGSVSFETLPPAPVFANPMLAASVPTKPPISIVAPTPAGLKMKGVASDTPVKPEAIKTQNTSSSAKSSPAKPNSTVILTSNSVSGGETVVGNAGLLKIKLSQLMGLLNQQLEIVEELEAEEKKLGEGVHVSKKIADLHNDVSQLTSQELTLIESFRQRWK
ncbi:hypothetical protein EON65_02880 [archaeon]|nr:MAG: hypothetical protein EON65_02880 [archaeon]